MKINRVSNGENHKPIKGAGGRRSRVSWLRTTKAGKEAISAFLQYLSAGASLRSAVSILGVSQQTVERWIRQGELGECDDSVWFVETIQGAMNRSIANAEVRVFKSKPLEWLRYSPTSKASGIGWNEDRGKGKEDDRKEGGKGGEKLALIDNKTKIEALIELRKAGLNLNTIIDNIAIDTRPQFIADNLGKVIEGEVYSGEGMTEGAGVVGFVNPNTGNPIHESQYTNHDIGRGIGELELTKGAGVSGGTPVGNGPNDLTNNSTNNSTNDSTASTTTTTTPNHHALTPNHNELTTTTTPNLNELTNTHSPHSPSRSGTPVRSGSNPGYGTPTDLGSNRLDLGKKVEESLLQSVENDDSVKGRVAAILAAARARATLGER